MTNGAFNHLAFPRSLLAYFRFLMGLEKSLRAGHCEQICREAKRKAAQVKFLRRKKKGFGSALVSFARWTW